jgi:hypothetical protein
MHIAVIDHERGLSVYIAEILTTWGVRCHEPIEASQANDVDPADRPVVIVPAMSDSDGLAERLEQYARRGGTVICMQPNQPLATLAGLKRGPDKTRPMRLRPIADPMVGPAGQPLVVVPPARVYEIQDDQTRPLAYLSFAGQYDGESVGVTQRPAGDGRIIALAFDLPRCVLLLRQGTPDRAEVIPQGCEAKNARPSHLAPEIGGAEAAWSPFTDLLCRYLVALVQRHFPAPMPLLSHLPGEAQGMVLLSGDEDYAQVADNDYQLGLLTDAGVRMNLYVIPEATQSTPRDVSRYRRHHDIGVHPNLRPLDGRPVQERVDDFERQLRLFASTFGFPARSVRNHCTAWAGYLELVEVQRRCGVRMDGNYFSGAYRRDRRPEPFYQFGAAMPMRFCHPDGRLVGVFQQHTHISDDISFSPDNEYSHKYTPDAWAAIFTRILDDMLRDGHFPFAFNFHPPNWRSYGEPCCREVLRQAAVRNVPVWSFDQWCRFWEARDAWRIEQLAYQNGKLTFAAQGNDCGGQLRWLLPVKFDGLRLTEINVDGYETPINSILRYGESVATITVQANSCRIEAVYSDCAIRGS